MRVTSKGQVTIPAEIRQRFGFLVGTEVEFVVHGGVVQLKHLDRPDRRRGNRAVQRLRGSATTRMTTDEILTRDATRA